MLLIIISFTILFISLIGLVVFLFFNKEKSKHELVLQHIEQTIAEQNLKSLKQSSQLLMIQDSVEFTEKSMEKVVNGFHNVSALDNPFLEQHLDNLDTFSKNSLDLIKIYGRFVKVLS